MVPTVISMKSINVLDHLHFGIGTNCKRLWIPTEKHVVFSYSVEIGSSIGGMLLDLITSDINESVQNYDIGDDRQKLPATNQGECDVQDLNVERDVL